MAEVSQYVFSHQELAEALIRKQGLHEGIWSILIEFGLGGANVPSPTGELAPAAILVVSKIGLQKTDKESAIAVDAARVNPAKK